MQAKKKKDYRFEPENPVERLNDSSKEMNETQNYTNYNHFIFSIKIVIKIVSSCNLSHINTVCHIMLVIHRIDFLYDVFFLYLVLVLNLKNLSFHSCVYLSRVNR